MKSISRKSGFTLIELLVVIAVIGVLAAVILASLNNARAKARDAKRLADLKSVQTALELYRNDNGDYPSGTAHTSALWLTQMNLWLVNNGYLPTVPVDPNGGFYVYYSDFVYTSTCDGLPWNSWEYVILFKSENPMNGVPDSNYASFNKCVHGALK